MQGTLTIPDPRDFLRNGVSAAQQILIPLCDYLHSVDDAGNTLHAEIEAGCSHLTAMFDEVRGYPVKIELHLFKCNNKFFSTHIYLWQGNSSARVAIYFPNGNHEVSMLPLNEVVDITTQKLIELCRLAINALHSPAPQEPQ